MRSNSTGGAAAVRRGSGEQLLTVPILPWGAALKQRPRDGVGCRGCKGRPRDVGTTEQMPTWGGAALLHCICMITPCPTTTKSGAHHPKHHRSCTTTTTTTTTTPPNALSGGRRSPARTHTAARCSALG